MRRGAAIRRAGLTAAETAAPIRPRGPLVGVAPRPIRRIGRPAGDLIAERDFTAAGTDRFMGVNGGSRNAVAADDVGGGDSNRTRGLEAGCR